MAIGPGTRVGPYEVTALIGEGGMGKVWRAHHTSLRRDDALKVLPDAFATDRDRLARFQHEAQVLASLNHPNIAHVYGLEHANGAQALVMELVEGPTLAERIAAGPIPVDEALRVAKQIADALVAAHEHGIIHRDLKPANVKVREDGAVKVLDFGLAKSVEPSDGSPSVSQSPTITTPAMTQAGVILGTAAYMSPEQARAQRVDKRTDIWAFGVVLFEMLTGRRAFAGDTVSDTIASVLKIEPDWQLLPAGTPAVVRRLLRRCLAKERPDRLADISDARLDLVEAIASPGGAAVDSTGKSARLPWSVAIVLAAVLLAGLAAALFSARVAPGASSAFHSAITTPADVGVFETGPPLALSPDGRYLAFTAADASRGRMLWLRRLDQTAAQPVPGTEGANAPFWSADSRFVAFVADGSLKKIDLLGGAAVTVAAPAVPTPGSWNRDDVILFNSSFAQISRVPAAGGTASPATTVDVQAGQRGHSFPYFLPDGRSFLYLVDSASGVPDLYVGALDSTERTLLLEDVSNAQYGAGNLLFLKGATLMAKPFDADRRTFTGDAEPLANQIQLSTLSLTSGTWRAGAYSVSEASALVYLRSASADSQLVWLDRSGKRLGVLGDPDSYSDVLLSPDGKRASVSVLDPTRGTRDIWVFDVARGIRNRVTFDSGDEFEGIWSPDNSRIVFNSTRRGGRDLYLKGAGAGAGAEELLLEGGLEKYAQSWSPDDKWLLYITTEATNNLQDIWVLPLTGDRTPRTYLATPYGEGVGARFSPDGNWISYTSNESGRQQAYIARFPNHGGREQVSTNGGLIVTWRKDGREVYYYEPASSGSGGRLMAVSLTYDAAGVSAGTPRPLTTVVPGGPRLFYDAMPDGQRFLVNTVLDRTTATPITLVVNWPALLGSAR
jgi:Tol biopolymer transport system component